MIRSMAALLAHWADVRPDKTALVFLEDGERVGATVTYAELDRRARAIAAALQSRAAPGDRALLLLASGVPFVEAFFGCLYAGVYAVPLYPPRPNRSFDRLSTVIHDAAPALALCATPTLAARHLELPVGVAWLAVDGVPSDATAYRPHGAAPDDIAFLQYTSGSTSTPRGVMVTHGNLLRNTAMLQEGFGHADGATVGGWLPLHHDMGLIGLVLQAVHLGGTCVLMSPMDFLRRPARWVTAIAEHRIEVSGGPNFAYDLVVERTTPEWRATLDLSHWAVAMNGSEPIDAATLDRFAHAFAPSGLRHETLCPGYGLAEATLFVSGSHRSRRPRTLAVDAVALERHQVAPRGSGPARQLAGSGTTCLGLEIAIVNPDTCERCAPDTIGEIWVRDAGVASGYWNNAAQSAATFGATLAASGEGPFLRTGDLGFVRDGEVFITGRLKDLILIDGRNHYPQDVEATVRESHPAVREGVAVFSIEHDAREQLVVVAEIDPRALKAGHEAASPEQARDAVRTAIVRAVADGHDVRVRDVVLARPGEILRTTSGKIQRKACRAKYLEERFALA